MRVPNVTRRDLKVCRKDFEVCRKDLKVCPKDLKVFLSDFKAKRSFYLTLSNITPFGLKRTYFLLNMLT